MLTPVAAADFGGGNANENGGMSQTVSCNTLQLPHGGRTMTTPVATTDVDALHNHHHHQHQNGNGGGRSLLSSATTALFHKMLRIDIRDDCQQPATMADDGSLPLPPMRSPRILITQAASIDRSSDNGGGVGEDDDDDDDDEVFRSQCHRMTEGRRTDSSGPYSWPLSRRNSLGDEQQQQQQTSGRHAGDENVEVDDDDDEEEAADYSRLLAAATSSMSASNSTTISTLSMMRPQSMSASADRGAGDCCNDGSGVAAGSGQFVIQFKEHLLASQTDVVL